MRSSAMSQGASSRPASVAASSMRGAVQPVSLSVTSVSASERVSAPRGAVTSVRSTVQRRASSGGGDCAPAATAKVASAAHSTRGA